MYLLSLILVSFCFAITQQEYEKLCEIGLRMLPYYPNNQSSLLSGCNNSCPLFATCNEEVTSLTIQYITGTLPSNLDIFSNLTTLTIQSTLTKDSFPESVCNLIMLKSLTISNTPLRGTVPYCVLGLKLTYLDLSNNLFSGTFPTYVQGSLVELRLNNNLFSGALPLMPYDLTVGIFSYNAFSSGLDARVTRAANLRIFYANNNRFSGSIPEQDIPSRTLMYMNLANNRLSGQIPYIGSMLQYLDLSYNQYATVNQSFMFSAIGYQKIVQVDLRGNRLSNPYPISKYLLDTQDINECDLLRYVCPKNGYCSDGWNPKLSYTCSCLDGYVLSKQLNDDICVDVNECLGNNACEPGACVNTEGSYYCCLNSEYNPTPSLMNATCKSCYSNYTYITNSNPETELENVSSILKCFGKCTDGTAYRTRNSLSSMCPTEALFPEHCEYPCTNIDITGIPARIAIEMLYTEVVRGSYLEEVTSLTNVSVDISHLTDTSTLTIECSSNCSKVVDLVNLIITSGITITENNGTVMASITTNSKVRVEGIIFGVFGFIILLSIFVGFVFFQYRTLSVLPKEVADSIRPPIFMRCCWNYQGDGETGYYYTSYSGNIDIDLSNYSNYTIEKVYNTVLVNNFVGAYEVQKARLANKAFCNKNWRNEKKSERDIVYDRYKALCSSFSWNDEGDGCPDIILAFHGTQYTSSKAICQTGFASLAKLDAGWYGKGIYFTSHSKYTLQYISPINPSIIISYVIPGNVYPVVERNDSEDNLVGKAIKSGYQANYVCVDTKGQIGEGYDEIVISSEAQILPLYIVKLNEKEIAGISMSLITDYVKLA